MNILDFISKIELEPLKQVYLLVGEDRYQLWLAEQAIIKRTFLESSEEDLVRFDKTPSSDELSVALASPGFFSTQTLGIIEDSSWFGTDKKSEDRKNDEARVADILANLPEESRVILKAVKADKRGSLYKKIATFGVLLEGDLLKGQPLRNYVQQVCKELHLNLQGEGLGWLLGQWDLLDGISAGLVRQELEKMWLYHNGKSLTRKEVEEILSELPEISSFKLLDAWGTESPEKGLAFLQDMLRNGEVPLKLLGLLTWHVRNLWQVKVLEKMPKDQIASQAGIRPFQVDRLLKTARKLTLKQVENLMLQLAETDLALKNGMNPEIALEILLLKGYGN